MLGRTPDRESCLGAHRDATGTWQAAAEPEPPSPAELYAALVRDFGPAGWEIRFTGAKWEAFRPGYIALHAPSAIALRDAIDVANPRPLPPSRTP